MTVNKVALKKILASEGLITSALAAGEIRDPVTGQTRSEIRAKLDSMSWDDRSSYIGKDLTRRHDRLLLREQKAARGLRLSSRPKDVAGIQGQRGQWGYEGKWDMWWDSEGKTPHAVMRGDEVVAWVIKVKKSARETGGMSYGGHTVEWVDYTAYTLDGAKIGYGGSKHADGVLNDVAAYLKKLPKLSSREALPEGASSGSAW